MEQIRIDKTFVAEVLDFDIPNRITRWKEFGGSGETSETRMLIDRFVSLDELKSGDVDYSNGGSRGIKLIIKGVEECDSGWHLYYEFDPSPEA